MKNNNKILGNYYEKKTVDYLKNQGYTIVETNYFYQGKPHRPLEIDIIATKSSIIYFFEVKYRSHKDGNFFPWTVKKLQNIKDCSENFLMTHGQYSHLWPKIQWILVDQYQWEILDVE
jgi:Holliday junction resolvase-like predicted endonuclease